MIRSAPGGVAKHQNDARVILASASTARAKLLQSAGVDAEIIPAQVNEIALRKKLTITTGPGVAEQLARAKALEVSARSPARLVIGADQVLECAGEIFDKPADLAEARAQLLRLRDRRHHLHSAVVLARDGAVLWHHVASAEMVMRNFSDDFLDDYLASAGQVVCTSVGAYQIEGLGVQLFAGISGDSFTIQGLPLLALLAALRDLGQDLGQVAK